MRSFLHLMALGAVVALATACDDDGKTDDTGAGDGGAADGGAGDGGSGDGGSTSLYSQATGTIDYTWQVGDGYDCDATIEFTGTPYAGDCEDCTFALGVDASITEDNGTADCWYYPPLTLIEGSMGWFDATDMAIAYAPSFTIAGYYGNYDYSNVFMAGYYQDWSYWGYGSYGPYWWPIAYDGGSYGTFSLTDNGDGTADIAWSWTTSWYDYDYTYSLVNQCGTDDYYLYGGYYAYGGSYTGTGSIDCYYYKGYGYFGSYYMDVWSFSLSADDTVSITVDTVAEDTAFDSYFYLTDDEACYLGGADDSFDCTYPPTDYQCPSMQAELAAGDYNVVVGNYGSCWTGTGEYQIVIDASSDPGLELTGDDVANEVVDSSSIFNEVTVTGSATLQ